MVNMAANIVVFRVGFDLHRPLIRTDYSKNFRLKLLMIIKVVYDYLTYYQFIIIYLVLYIT